MKDVVAEQREHIVLRDTWRGAFKHRYGSLRERGAETHVAGIEQPGPYGRGRRSLTFAFPAVPPLFAFLATAAWTLLCSAVFSSSRCSKRVRS